MDRLRSTHKTFVILVSTLDKQSEYIIILTPITEEGTFGIKASKKIKASYPRLQLPGDISEVRLDNNDRLLISDPDPVKVNLLYFYVR